MIDLAPLALEAARARGLGNVFVAAGLRDPYPAPRALVVFLPYAVSAIDSLPEQGRDAAQGTLPAYIAPFARRHWYAYLAAELKGVAAELRSASGLPKAAFRVACNSTLPERALGAPRGKALRNGLLFSEGLGSLFVIGALFIPGDPGVGRGRQVVAPDAMRSSAPGIAPAAPPRHPLCASCGACAEACPAGAIAEGYDKDRCLQRYAAVDTALPGNLMDSWGPRLYGCHACQAVCPLNRAVVGASVPPGLPEIGDSVDALAFLRRDDEELEAFLRGSAMGLSWLSRDALRRNALLAALHWSLRGAGGEGEILELCRRFGESASPALAAAAAHAAARLSGSRRSSAPRP